MTTRHRMLAVSFVALLVPALGRTDPNSLRHPIPFLVRGSEGWPVEASARVPGDAATIAPARAEATTAVVQVPLPAGAVQLDSTYYDLQDLGSMGTRIVATADGRVHVTWEDDLCDLDAGGCPPNVNAVQPYPQRGMAYGIRSPAGLWTRVGKVQQPGISCIPFCQPEHFGGFGTITVLPDGRAAISQALNEDGCDLRGNFYLEDAPGGSAWTAYLTPFDLVLPSNLFPQVIVRPNGSFVTMGEVPRVSTGCTHCGVAAINVSYLAAPGTPFTCPTGWQSGTWTSVVNMSMFKGGFSAFPSLAVSANGRVGIAVTDIGGNAWLIESSTGTFTAGTVTIRNLTGYTDATITSPDSTSTQFRPSINCYIAYNDTTPNVVWAETQARKNGTTLYYPDYHSRIRHWSSTDGLSTVKQVQPFEANTYENIYLGYPGPSAGFNHISVDWPQVGFSPDGSETYMVWTRFTDAQIDPTAHRDAPDFFTGVGFGDIVASVKRQGQAWSAPQNLTNTPTTDERYPAIPIRGNVAGKIQLLFQASSTNQAGVIQGQDRGATPVNLVRRIAYLEAPLAGSVLAVGDPAGVPAASALRIIPNPARGRVRFALPPGGGATTVNVYSVSGALVARVPLGAGSETTWDGRDQNARPLPSGVYLARVEGSGPASKLLFLR